MSDLAEFLLARIADDEAVARHMLAFSTEHTEHYGHQDATFDRWSVRRDEDELIVEAKLGIFRPKAILRVHHFDGDLADHIARWDPARVLAECEAKRRILETHRPYRRIYGLGCDVCLHPRRLTVDVDGWPCPTLRLLALPYADHSDYRQEWRP